MKEIWKPIVEFENTHLISNYGKVKRLKRMSKTKHRSGKKFYRHLDEKILKSCIGKRGYYVISIRLNNRIKRYTIHRLIAIHYIPNTNNKPHINHIDGNKLNNSIDNLEWCTNQENMQHAYDKLGKKGGMTGKFNISRSKKVYQYNLKNEFIKEYPSAKEASRKLGLCHSSICYCARGNTETSGGYIWKYKKK